MTSTVREQKLQFSICKTTRRFAGPSLLSCGLKPSFTKICIRISFCKTSLLLTHNVGNQDRRCSLSIRTTFRRLCGGEESIVFVSHSNCTMAKGHRVANWALPSNRSSKKQKQSSGHPTRFDFHLQHPVDIYHIVSLFFYWSLEQSSSLCHISESQCFVFQVFPSLPLRSG